MNDILQSILAAIETKKGLQPVVLELGDRSSIADYFVVCHAESERQVVALHDEILERLRLEHAWKPIGVEGLGERRWVLLDYGAVVIHLFLRDLRYRYDLEDLWRRHESTAETVRA